MRVCQWFPAAAPWVGCETASAGQLCIQSCGSLQYRAALTSQSQWGKRQTRVPLLHSLQGSFSACGPPLSQSPPHFPKAQSPAYKATVTASVSLSISAGGRELCLIDSLTLHIVFAMEWLQVSKQAVHFKASLDFFHSSCEGSMLSNICSNVSMVLTQSYKQILNVTSLVIMHAK